MTLTTGAVGRDGHQTTRCVGCGGAVASRCGHVHTPGGRTVVAGWCAACGARGYKLPPEARRPGARPGCPGCHGPWLLGDGLAERREGRA